MNSASTAFARFLLCGILIVSACSGENATKVKNKRTPAAPSEKDYLATIIALDTLSNEAYKKEIDKEYSLFKVHDSSTEPYFHYFKARKYLLERKPDSAVAEYQKMKGRAPNDEVELLKSYSILGKSFGDGLMVESTLMRKIFDAMEVSEKVHSRITYRFYDLLAKAYFQNNNEKKSLEYSALYFKNHPYNAHVVVKQRYYDISFLLASRLGDFKKMKFYNIMARELAFKISDSLAIARTYDNESQIYARQNQTKKSVEYSRIYFNYLKRTNNLNDIAYNNLATSFIQNKQLDSAIKYYKEGIELEKKNKFKKQKGLYYQGLREAYLLKHDYVKAMEAADNDDVLITPGTTPSRPDTGYGYIQYIDDDSQHIKKVKTFTEKPNLELAQMFLNSGDFVWNSGIFIWNVQSIMKAFRQNLPEISEIFEEGATSLNTPKETNFIVKAYSHCRNISIDYGIMEKVDNVYVVLADIGWSDLGTWNSLYTINQKDEAGNVVGGDVMLYDTKNCIIKTPKDRLVVVEGLEGYIVAEHDNVLMICRLSEEQKVKEFMSDAKSKKGAEYI